MREEHKSEKTKNTIVSYGQSEKQDWFEVTPLTVFLKASYLIRDKSQSTNVPLFNLVGEDQLFAY